MSTEVKTLFEKLLAIMETCTYVQKTKRVEGYGAGYMAVTHDVVMAKVRPYLIAARILPVFDVLEASAESLEVIGPKGVRSINRATARVSLTLHNVDAPGDCCTVHGVGQGDDYGDKAMGKAISYACKGCVLKVLMLETGEDSDNDASVEQATKETLAEEQRKTQAKMLIKKLRAANEERGEVYQKKLDNGEHSTMQIVSWLQLEIKKIEEGESDGITL